VRCPLCGGGLPDIAVRRLVRAFLRPVSAGMRDATAPATASVNCAARSGPMSTIVLVIVVLLLLGALPSWPHSRSWGYGPSGLLGLVLVVLVIMALTGRL
jgi:hypothetical protein